MFKLGWYQIRKTSRRLFAQRFFELHKNYLVIFDPFDYQKNFLWQPYMKNTRVCLCSVMSSLLYPLRSLRLNGAFFKVCNDFYSQCDIYNIFSVLSSHQMNPMFKHICIYMFIKYCVFSLKFKDFFELCQFCCSAGVLPAWCVYTHTDSEGKQGKAES